MGSVKAGPVVQAVLQWGSADCRLEVGRQLTGRIGAEGIAVHPLHVLTSLSPLILMHAGHTPLIHEAFPTEDVDACRQDSDQEIIQALRGPLPINGKQKGLEMASMCGDGRWQRVGVSPQTVTQRAV